MALDQTIDSAVEDFNKSLTEAQDLFIEDVNQLQEEGLSTEEILLILAGISMADYWLQDLQMQKAITRLMGSFDTLLDDAVFFGKVTENQLFALRSMQEASILRYTTDLGDRIRLSLVQGVLQKMPKADIRQMLLQDLSIKPYQVNTIIETSMATYSRSLTLLQLEDSPEQTLIYQGPLDSKTRPVCIRMLKEGGMTQNQVEAKYPGALRDGGGFNCRHQWVPLSSKTRNKDIQQRAKVAYQGMMDKAKRKGRAFKIPKTLEQYYRDRP
jgi:hypothetical protein